LFISIGVEQRFRFFSGGLDYHTHRRKFTSDARLTYYAHTTMEEYKGFSSLEIFDE